MYNINSKRHTTPKSADKGEAPSVQKISIIVPIYNVEKYIRQCLDSIVNQTYRNLEIILVDDGSPDACGAVCDEYAKMDGRITVIHKENAGVGAARNDGIDRATGEWLMFVDPDDWLELDCCENAIKAAQKSDCDVIYFQSDKRDKTGNLIQVRPKQESGFLKEKELAEIERKLCAGGVKK